MVQLLVLIGFRWGSVGCVGSFRQMSREEEEDGSLRTQTIGEGLHGLHPYTISANCPTFVASASSAQSEFRELVRCLGKGPANGSQ